MRTAVRTILPGVLLLIAAWRAWGGDLIPTPEFTRHVVPISTTPAPPSVLWEYLDLAAMVGAIALATLLALVWRRRWGLLLLSIASLAWLGFWRGGCICPIGAIQNVSLAAFDPTYTIPATVVAFFTVPLVTTLFFGRTFCAAVCPLGAMQELVAVRPLRVPAALEHALGLLPYVYLGAAVIFAATGTAFIICRYDPFVGLFRLTGNANMIVFGGCVLVVGLFIGRPYCRYFCPYGAVLALLSKVSRWHVRIPPDECINCRLCEDACPYGAIRRPTAHGQAEQRTRRRVTLAMLLGLLPVLIVLGLGLGRLLAVPMSRVHPDVQLAEQVLREENAKAKGLQIETTDASDAFRNTGQSLTDLYGRSVSLRRRFAWLGSLLGAWVGLVVGVKLIHLALRRRRIDYQADKASCVSCGRCFWYCPCEQERLGLIEKAG